MSISLSKDRKTIDGMEFRLSPNAGRVFDPRFVVLHYTAGPSLDAAVERFTSAKSEVSAHFVISETGQTTQCVPLDKAAWHAGESFWKPRAGSGRLLGLKGLNRYAFGIELVNAGPLRRTNGGAFYTWWGRQVPPNDIVEIDPTEPQSFNRRYWARFPEDQINAALSLVKLLSSEFPIEEILGHSDIAQGRKQDPGPAFPMSHIRSLVQGRSA